MNNVKNPYAGYRHSTEIINHAVWVYFRFTPSYRDVKELLVAHSAIALTIKRHNPQAAWN